MQHSSLWALPGFDACRNGVCARVGIRRVQRCAHTAQAVIQLYCCSSNLALSIQPPLASPQQATNSRLTELAVRRLTTRASLVAKLLITLRAARAGAGAGAGTGETWGCISSGWVAARGESEGTPARSLLRSI